MNEAKALAARCGEYIQRLRDYVPSGSTSVDGSAGMSISDLTPGASLDQHWISIGATDLQTGFMAVVRGIAQPTNF